MKEYKVTWTEEKTSVVLAENISEVHDLLESGMILGTLVSKEIVDVSCGDRLEK